MKKAGAPEESAGSSMLSRLAAFPLLADIDAEDLSALAACAENVTFAEGQTIFRHGDKAEHLYLLESGHVALKLEVPGLHERVVETLGAGEVLGWSWLTPPYRWHFDALALQEVRAVRLEVSGVRSFLDTHPALGAVILYRCSITLLDRLQSTRHRLLDWYKKPSGPAPETSASDAL
jgi:CRP-like cAMP-binding protein